MTNAEKYRYWGMCTVFQCIQWEERNACVTCGCLVECDLFGSSSVIRRYGHGSLFEALSQTCQVVFCR